MTEFHLGSVDWDSVSLLHGAHLRAETAFLEDLVRWSWHHGRPHGIIRLEEDDLQVSGSSTDYEITLHHCRAITPQGYLVDVQEPVRLQGSNDQHPGSIVPLYLGVAVEKESAPVAPAQSQSLLECRSLHWGYTLSCEGDSSDVDWLQIGQMQREGSRFGRDAAFIPECVHLNSHPGLISKVGEIRQKAQEGLRELQKHLNSGQVSAGVMAASIAPAAVAVDWYAHPRAYLERLAVVLTAQQSLLWLVDQKTWGRAHDLLQVALDYLEENARSDRYGVDWGHALTLVKDALAVLVPVFRDLRQVRVEIPSETPAPEITEEPIRRIGGSQVGPLRRGVKGS